PYALSESTLPSTVRLDPESVCWVASIPLNSADEGDFRRLVTASRHLCSTSFPVPIRSEPDCPELDVSALGASCVESSPIPHAHTGTPVSNARVPAIGADLDTRLFDFGGGSGSVRSRVWSV